MRRFSTHLLLLTAGFLTFAIAMGIGRFAYTPIFPYMQLEELLNPFTAGFLATLNYIGYFIGAVAARYVRHNLKGIYIGLTLNILTTLLMGLTLSYELWSVLRLVSGITSGIVFVCISNVVMDRLRSSNSTHLSGWLFGGVGFGILISGLLIPTLHSIGGWQFSWITLALLCLLMMLFIIPGLRKKPAPGDTSSSRERAGAAPAVKKQISALYISYTCQGFGYIIFGTFITALLEESPLFVFPSSYVWAVVGLGAIPSCLFWAWLGNKTTNLQALKYAYFVQIISIIIPIFTDNITLVLISAFGFGSTFMGIVMLTLTIARSLAHRGANPVSGLTSAYAVGQLAGPVAAGALITTNDYFLAFLVSAIVLIIALANLIMLTPFERSDPHAIREY